jgi:hypothetical protein
MTKHFCDICEEEITYRSYDIKMNAHIRSTDPLQGHSTMVNGVLHPVSSVERSTMCCLPCYNKVMYPLWDSIQKLKAKL